MDKETPVSRQLIVYMLTHLPGACHSYWREMEAAKAECVFMGPDKKFYKIRVEEL